MNIALLPWQAHKDIKEFNTGILYEEYVQAADILHSLVSCLNNNEFFLFFFTSLRLPGMSHCVTGTVWERELCEMHTKTFCIKKL